jgi:hypothetical protein
VTQAAWLMRGGAALSVFNSVIAAIWARGSILSFIRPGSAGRVAPGSHGAALISDIAGSTLVAGGVIGAGLWLWMAWKNKRGRNWARILSTVFFGISCLSVISTVADAQLGLKILGLVSWVVGLAAIILLWQPETGQYCRAVQAARAYAAYLQGWGPRQEQLARTDSSEDGSGT